MVSGGWSAMEAESFSPESGVTHVERLVMQHSQEEEIGLW